MVSTPSSPMRNAMTEPRMNPMAAPRATPRAKNCSRFGFMQRPCPISSLDPHHGWRLGPEIFEVIVFPFFGSEDVHHDVTVVEEHPTRGLGALPPHRAAVLGVPQLVDDFV